MIPMRWPLSTDAAKASQNPLAMIRKSTADDVSALVHIENRAFVTDRISRRSFRYLMSKANAVTLVAVGDSSTIRGYAIILFNRGTSLARLYSIAVDPDCHRRRAIRAARGIGSRRPPACRRLHASRGARRRGEGSGLL